MTADPEVAASSNVRGAVVEPAVATGAEFLRSEGSDSAQSSNVDALQRRTIRVLMVSQVIGTIGVGIAPSIGILLAGQVTHSEALAGSARTASTLGAALLGIPLGNLAARRGRRVALASGWWLAGAGAAVLVVAAQWSLVVPLFLGLFLIGSGTATSLQSRFAATDLADVHSKARALSLVLWVGTFGSVIGPNLGVPGERVGDATGLTPFAGAFLIAAAGLVLAGMFIFVWLRPDPLFVLREAASGKGVPGEVRPAKGRVRHAISEMRASPLVRVATLTIVTGQVVMAMVMTMTPVHVDHHGGSVTLVGITISLHIVGMYFFSPLIGALTDRWGHRQTIAVGIAILVTSLILGAAKPDDMRAVVVALILLGLGWSFVNVAGSALFSTVVSGETRASSQGGVDALSNLGGAAAALVAGPLMAVTNFSVLSMVAMAGLLPLTVVVATRTLSPDP